MHFFHVQIGFVLEIQIIYRLAIQQCTNTVNYQHYVGKYGPVNLITSSKEENEGNSSPLSITNFQLN